MQSKFIFPCLIALAIFAGACTQVTLAQEAATTQPATPPTTQPSTPPASEQTSDASPAVIHWLDKIDAAGRSLKSLTGELRYEVIQGALGDKQIRLGSLFYDAQKPAKFAVHFDRLLAGRRLLRENRWYIFDGRWMVESIGDQKQFIKREITDPNAKDAADANPLTDGQGPFALPITLQKDQVLRKYNVKLLAEPTDDSPALKIRLTPHVAQRGQFTQIDLTYDSKTMLPTRVDTQDETENQTAVILSNVKIDQAIEAVVFDTTPPKSTDGWTVEIKPWGK